MSLRVERRVRVLLGFLVLQLVAFSSHACQGLHEPGESGPLPGNTASPESEIEPDSLMEIQLPCGYGAHNSWIAIYFTDPVCPLASQETGGLDQVLVTAIDAARLSIDLAVYSISLRNVRDALIRAQERGVLVRIVTESDNQDSTAVQALLEADVPLLGDRREGLMHDKFMVIDRSEVWLGSMNYTYSGVYEDNNNLLGVRSEKLAASYLAEFDEMFEVDFGDSHLEVLFSPDDGVSDRLVSIIRKAEQSIDFMAFSFTSDNLGKVIRDGWDRGLEVKGVMDADQIAFNIGTEYDLFKQDEMDVYLDGGSGQMHHKVIIIDGEIVITGSYNFTRSAETRNDENVVLIYDEDIAGFFLQEFERVYRQAR
jgi:phosphatidylserine/phosphatidylglycerophosphate/cardiolipin synthase-like enzyme